MSLYDHVKPLDYASQVVAFYSYKGGVGRTMALCNVASHIAWLHARRAAIERPGSGAVRTSQPIRILCLDLDLEAPGIPAYIPPPKGTKVKGFLGLLQEYFKERAKWGNNEDLKGQLRRVFGEDLLQYAYAAPKADNLWIMPSGAVEPSKANDVRIQLHELLTPVRNAQSKTEAVPFFPELREVLRDLFDYTFVDARTGLADTAYATTAVLADEMVFLFRPNVTQLMGIQDVFGRFLSERNLNAERDERIPAIPVLSPRPNSSTPRLKEVREIAKKRVFKWLMPHPKAADRTQLDPYAPQPPMLLELPFDSSLEVGERLVVSADSDTQPEDPEAPLYKAYAELAREIQKRNAKRDILGARFLEAEHYTQGRKDEALNCLLVCIASEPDNVSFWKDLWKRFGDHLTQSDRAAQQLYDFCEEAHRLPESQPVARFFGSLSLTEMCEAREPGRCSELLRELWATAYGAMDGAMLSAALKCVGRHLGRHQEDVPIPTAPDLAAVTSALFLRDLNGKLTPESLFRCLVEYEGFFEKHPAYGRLDIELFEDQLKLADRDSNQSAVLGDLATAYLHHGDFHSAFAAYTALVSFRSCSDEWKMDFISLQISLLPRPIVERSIHEVIPPHWQPLLLLMLEISEASEIETVRAKLIELSTRHPGFGKDPELEFCSLMQHRQFERAAEFLSERLGNLIFKVGISELGKLYLAQWLAGKSSFDSGFTKTIPAHCSDRDPTDVGHYVALAACPDWLAKVSVERLAQPQWATQRFQWLVWACLTDTEGPSARAELAGLLEDKPLLACHCRKDPEFRFLRFILERHRDLGHLNAETFERRIQIIDAIESVRADFGPEPDAMALPTPVTSASDPRFGEIVNRWKRNLAWVQDDKTMGPVVRKLLEAIEDA